MLATAVFLPTTAPLQIALLAWALLHLGVQLAWTITLVGDAQKSEASGALTRGGVGFFMVATCFLADLWNGFVLVQLLRVAALRLKEIDAKAAERLERAASDAGKLLLVGIVAFTLGLVLTGTAEPAEEESDIVQRLLTERPSLAEEYGSLNASLLAAFYVAYAWFALRTIQRLVPELVRVRAALRALPRRDG